MTTTDARPVTYHPTCPGCAARQRVEAAAAGSELMRLRYPPTGDRELWVRYGPAGPPPDGESAP